LNSAEFRAHHTKFLTRNRAIARPLSSLVLIPGTPYLIIAVECGVC